jgi:hypothetical protein
MNFRLRSVFCWHLWIILDNWNIHRTVDNAVIGLACRERCTKCGHTRIVKHKF